MAPIQYCSINGGNFGDDINLQLWERLFPNLRELNGKVLLYGIGTLLDGRHDRSIRKVVLGTGCGEANVSLPDPNWDFRWVRGPKTAEEFGLSRELGLGDASILWPELVPGHDVQGPIGLIPHYATWDSFDWHHVARRAGLQAINPRQSPQQVINQLKQCSRVLAESLHGAICADAMGIPWAACVLAHRFNEFKWRDWLATIDRPYAPLMMDRPLIRSLTRTKALANRLARLVNYQRRTRFPALRPIAAATDRDVRQVAAKLREYGRQAENFSCTNQAAIALQRRQMQWQCEKFAHDYQLLFTP